MESIFSKLDFYLNLLVIIGVIAVSIPYIVGRFKKGREETQEESNRILRDLVDDQKRSIECLEIWQKEATEKIAMLEGQVKVLTAKKGDLESLISKALNEFFENHPNVANKIDGKFKKN